MKVYIVSLETVVDGLTTSTEIAGVYSSVNEARKCLNSVFETESTLFEWNNDDTLTDKFDNSCSIYTKGDYDKNRISVYITDAIVEDTHSKKQFTFRYNNKEYLIEADTQGEAELMFERIPNIEN